MTQRPTTPPTGGLYDPAFERDSCGFGLIANLDDKASTWLVQTAVESLRRMTHRGAVAPDMKSGDGCGLLIKRPEAFLHGAAKDAGIELHDLFAAGAVFLHTDSAVARSARDTLELELRAEGLTPAGWRTVPTDPSACGDESLASLPLIEHIFVNAPDDMPRNQFQRHLFIARRRAEKRILASGDDMFYVASLSVDVVSYKALVLPANLPVFYPDLVDDRMESSVCVFHQRFSTNTWPQWRLAQPFRYLAHNGEINTIRGNRLWARARAHKFKSPLLPNLEELLPIVSDSDSDSASLDNMLEMLLAGGLDVFLAMRVLIPPAWQNVEGMDPDLRAFYQYYALNTDPWDGPAGVVLTDGRYAACVLDRNGLRPARYVVTKDRHITLASEIGVYEYAPEDVVAKGRLGPGQMLAVDTERGEILTPNDIDNELMSRAPFKRWLKDQVQYLEPALRNPRLRDKPLEPAKVAFLQKIFNLTFEERDQVLRVLAEAGHEAVGSMGDDTPMAVLSTKVRALYDYFRQQFAQVTNPPIDPLRESLVMSLETNIGAETNLFEATARQAKRLVVESPVLSEAKFEKLIAQEDPAYRHQDVQLLQRADESLVAALDRICLESEAAVRDGIRILVLTDWTETDDDVPVHALLATGAVHHYLVDRGLRCDANLIVATGTARDPHHFACLLGYGATAIYPYLAYMALQDMTRTGEIKVDEEAAGMLGRNFRKGINKGLYKILSKMGISTMWSYRGAQLFEIVGLHDEVVDRCFKGTTSRIQGARFEHLEADQALLAERARSRRKHIAHGGLLKYVHGGEYHAYHPDVVQELQAVARTGKAEDYARYKALINDRPPAVLRDLLSLRTDIESIDIADVESEQEILPRFETAGMSLGALSPEAHEALAIAMNRIGGRSNSGEGGEHVSRYGTERRSKIKQVASGRFGVTPHYLVNAEVLQIKIAQGAKPGEGGQLPGHKVNEMIASLRFAKRGIGLISPPPHHDIYSIEDLAQLIFDLKQVNPDAQVSVKLVAEPGVGTIAAGVAKAYADLITISGYDGGTGASPLTSVKYAGSPWELGLAETHQTLVANNLREKVRVQTDGGLKTGLDVVKAAILGAESFGFGTAPMVALGCKYLRICHLNNCATGVATQNELLRREHFTGLPEMVINYFRCVAAEVRELLAQLGVRRLVDLIGRTDLLEVLPGATDKQRSLDLSAVLDSGLVDERGQFCIADSNDPFDKAELANQMLDTVQDSIANRSGGTFDFEVRNFNRSIGARISGEIARHYGDQGMADQPITLRLSGSAGQSLGVWNAGGLNIELTGDANDYVGKGMAGGRIAIKPPDGSSFASHETPIVGNTCLYGATGGDFYAAGTAGERFAVRNSGANAVIEGVGDHGCEYMTGGVVAVLGSTGLNFGAGMTGGFAYVLDSDRTFVDRYNHELIDIRRISTESMEAHVFYLREMVREHVRLTGSAWGAQILDELRDYVGKFWLVIPKAADIDSLLETLRRAA